MQLSDFQVPEGVNPAVAGLAWMIGSWQGRGHYQPNPDEDPIELVQTVEFQHNQQPYLFYLAQWFELNADGAVGEPIGMESGFWHPYPDASLEIVLTNAEQRVEVWAGKIQMSRIDVTTDAVARTAHSDVPYTGGSRLYGFVENDLMWAHDRATEDEALRPYMWARLSKING